jgi:hypothetical protein
MVKKPIVELTLLSLASSQMGIIVSSSKRAEKVSEMTGVLLLLQINLVIKRLCTVRVPYLICISATLKRKFGKICFATLLAHLSEYNFYLNLLNTFLNFCCRESETAFGSIKIFAGKLIFSKSTVTLI